MDYKDIAITDLADELAYWKSTAFTYREMAHVSLANRVQPVADACLLVRLVTIVRSQNEQIAQLLGVDLSEQVAA